MTTGVVIPENWFSNPDFNFASTHGQSKMGPGPIMSKVLPSDMEPLPT
jgi:hypothetical protein